MALYFMTETLIVQKVAYIRASFFKREFIFSSEKNQLQFGKKMEKFRKIFLNTLIARKKIKAKKLLTSFLA